MANLEARLKLEDVAAVAGFSPYHFHRIFQALAGETLHAFTNRVRLERAVYLMAHGTLRSLTDVALAVGFSSSSAFSRVFRQHLGVSPRMFDIGAFRRAGRSRLVVQLTMADHTGTWVFWRSLS